MDLFGQARSEFKEVGELSRLQDTSRATTNENSNRDLRMEPEGKAGVFRYLILERATRFELATKSLGSSYSTN